MQIKTKNTERAVEVHIEENIKSLNDNDVIKKQIENIWHEYDDKAINIYIHDSFIITSSVIGFLIKFIKKDKMNITLYIYNKELYEMLDDMNLVEVLNIKKAIL